MPRSKSRVYAGPAVGWNTQNNGALNKWHLPQGNCSVLLFAHSPEVAVKERQSCMAQMKKWC